MTQRRVRVAVVVAVVAGAPSRARADTTWMPGAARAVARSSSASRDVAVTEYAYGPRAHASFGGEVGLLEFRGARSSLRLGAFGMLAVDEGSSKNPLPSPELFRDVEGVSAALALPRAGANLFGKGALLELGLVVGHDGAHAASGYAVPDAYRTTDIPFGGGGWFLEPDVALRVGCGARCVLITRIEDRVYMNALPLMVGQRAASDVVADYLDEGLVQAPGAELTLHWRLSDWIRPTVSLFGEELLAHDSSAESGVWARVMAGPEFPGRAGELWPFVAFDAGNGPGLLINRRELRLAVGVRYAPF
jgi:hypothetical protein